MLADEEHEHVDCFICGLCIDENCTGEESEKPVPCSKGKSGGEWKQYIVPGIGNAALV